ncbi:hypothetical protein DLAC_01005 [Tieghemostelium lacteum]|uniref:Phospholipid scramblase n=1 Tax=Tieghemostelium lacteum TaxID=361077 RepID=A0A152A7H8_TIELA|nr:hypothetical protein DLAC_01005 [Tieghemostelium lacteum]|eukprot:KYR02189.1 hypothetical protein DLAC_01005 [Tieghemostelium lacteum]
MEENQENSLINENEAVLKKLYVKQSVNSIRGKYKVKDEQQNVCYIAKGVWAWGSKLNIFDANGQLLGVIKEQMATILAKYKIFNHNGELLTRVCSTAYFKQRYTLEDTFLKVRGSFFGYEFTINDGLYDVAKIKKAKFTFGDSYEISIMNLEHEFLVVCMVLILDLSNHEHHSS